MQDLEKDPEQESEESIGGKDKLPYLPSKLSRRSMIGLIAGVGFLPLISEGQNIESIFGVTSEALAATKPGGATRGEGTLTTIYKDCHDILDGTGGECLGCLEAVSGGFKNLGGTFFYAALTAAKITGYADGAVAVEGFDLTETDCIQSQEGGDMPCEGTWNSHLLRDIIGSYALCILGVPTTPAIVKEYLENSIYVNFFNILVDYLRDIG